jgi:hypothetical protein
MRRQTGAPVSRRRLVCLRIFMALAAHRVGEGSQRSDKSKRGNDKDRFDFHKFAFIGVQLNAVFQFGRKPGRTSSAKPHLKMRRKSDHGYMRGG